jgi:single-strand DNA-binding protein
MKSVNKVFLLGNVTRDADLREISGKKVCSFGLATNRVWKDTNGDTQSLPEYHNIVAWAGLAQFCSQYVKKAKPLYIEGHLKTGSWETPEGIKKDRTEIILENIVLLGAKEASAHAPGADDEDSQ